MIFFVYPLTQKLALIHFPFPCTPSDDLFELAQLSDVQIDRESFELLVDLSVKGVSTTGIIELLAEMNKQERKLDLR